MLAIDAERDDAEGQDAFHRALLDGISDAGLGLVITDGRRVLAVNDAFARMMGCPAPELVGLDTTMLVVPEERGEGRARQDARLEQGRPQSFRCHFLRADGTRFLGHVTGEPLRVRPPRFVAIVRDLTEEERAREALEAARLQVAQSEKLSALGSLVSGVAHEVRTPLTYLSTSLYVLQRRVQRALEKPGADPALATLLPDVAATLEASERIARLVEDLGRFTRLRARDAPLVALDGAVRQAVELFRATHRGGVEVRAQLAAPDDARVDALAMQQVVLNLLTNAAEASPPGAAVRVRTSAAEGGALLEVEDEGVGIPPEVLPRIFDPFFTTKPQGTGLGLSIVRRLVEQMGGRIDVVSRPGAGATFRVRLSRGDGQRQGI